MKILYILNNLNRIAPNTVIVNIILNLKEKLDDLYILGIHKSSEDNYKELFEKNSIKYLQFESYQDCVLNVSKIVEIANKFDIMHLNQYKPNELGNLINKFNNKIKIISTCHSVEDEEVKARKFIGDEKVASIVRLREQSNFYQKHNKVIAVSDEVNNYLKKIGCRKSKVIYNGINYNSFPIFKKENKERDVINFCQIGHIMPLKNQLFSLKIIKYLIKNKLNIKFHIYGSDKYAEAYKNFLIKYIDKNNLRDHIYFYGEVSFETLFVSLQKMNILLMPSKSEGLPLSLLESFYFEIVAIVSTYGGMKEIIKNNKNGLIIDINSKKDFEVILKYCRDEKYISNGKETRKIALKRFNSKIMSQKYFAEYQTLLK